MREPRVMFGIMGYISPSMASSMRMATVRMCFSASRASAGNSLVALACRASWLMLLDERASKLCKDMSSAAMARCSVGDSECSDSAVEIKRFGTVTFSLSALATSAASSSTVTHTSRRFFVPAGEFSRRRLVRRGRDSFCSVTHSPNPSTAQRSDPETGDHTNECVKQTAAGA